MTAFRSPSFNRRMPWPGAPLLVLAVLLASCAPSTQSAVRISPSCSSPDQPVSVPDPSLRKAVTRQAGLPEDAPLDCLALAGLRTVRTSDVERLDGLEHAVNLSSLTVERSRIASLQPLRGLDRLNTVILPGGSVPSLEPLRGLAHLQFLDLTDNRVTDLTPLTELPQLSVVKLSGNSIADLSPLADSTELIVLEADGGQIEDLTPLSGRTELHRLKLNGNRVRDASVLSGLPRLAWLELADNDLTDMGFIAGLRIELLDLSGNRIEDIAPLGQSLSVHAGGRFDLRENCLRIDGGDPFLQDLRDRRVNVMLEPQKDCTETAEE